MTDREILARAREIATRLAVGWDARLGMFDAMEQEIAAALAAEYARGLKDAVKVAETTAAKHEKDRDILARTIKDALGKAMSATPLPGSRPEWGDWSAKSFGSINLKDVADACLSALRERGRTIVPMEPTEAMLKAGAAEAPESPEDEDGCAYFYRGDVPAPIWRAMLSAASSEPQT